jgi:hypothetical protein
MTHPLELKLEIQREQGSLLLTITATNTGDAELGLLNRVVEPGPSGRPSYDPSNAYIDIESVGDSALHVRKLVLPVPRGLQVGELIIPGITRLGPRASSRDQVRLPLPVPVFNPFRKALIRLKTPGATDVVASAKRIVDKLVFSQGFFEIPPDARLIPVSADPPDVFRIHPPGIATQRQVVAVAEAALEEPVEALDYEAVVASPPSP